MNKNYKYLFGLMMVFALFLTGCGGSSNDKQVIEYEGPDAAVVRIANSIRAAETSSGNDTATPTTQLLNLYDLAGNVYVLTVASITRTDLNATVACNYTYGTGSNEALSIVFGLEYDEGTWWLDTVEVKDGATPTPVPDPTATGLEGYVKDANGNAVAGASVQAFSVNDLTTVVNHGVTDSTGKYSIELAAGDYLLVATKDGYTICTISATVPASTN